MEPPPGWNYPGYPPVAPEMSWSTQGNWNMYAPSAPSAPQSFAPMSGGCPTWVDAQGGDVPHSAVTGGYDNEPLFVGRAVHEGALIPGKVQPSHGVCYISWGGLEHAKEEYQVLCGCEAIWVPCVGGVIPLSALPSGETEDGEPLFVGRVQHQGTWTIGKVQESHNVCYIPYGGQEIAFSEYEVLVTQ